MFICGLLPALSNSTELAGHLAGLRVQALIVSPYTEKEILHIINKRLDSAKQQLLARRRGPRGLPQPTTKALPPLFAPAALLLFARKAANSNGDIRMALSGLWYVRVKQQLQWKDFHSLFVGRVFILALHYRTSLCISFL